MILSLMQHHFNNSVSAETGHKPFSMMMDSADTLYYQLEPEIYKASVSTVFVKRLDANLKLIRDISAQHQVDLAKRRLQEEEKRNQYAVGDLMLKTIITSTKL